VRVIVHYDQPRYPFLNAKELRDDGTKKAVWDLMGWGGTSTGRIKKAYQENLRIVMNKVERRKEQLPGRVILTADHGEMPGEAGISGHRAETHMPAPVEVTWLD
jgi:hypothetical protein